MNTSPFMVADEWNLDRRAVLASFIKGCEAGLFSLHWQTQCTRCGALMDKGEHLHQLSDQETCVKCGNDYENFLDENVTVSFSVNPRFHRSKFRRFRQYHPRDRASDVRVTGLDCLLSPAFAEVFRDQTLSESESLSIGHMTLLFTDIVDSTRIYATHGDIPAFKAVRHHFTLLENAVQQNHGVLVKTIGDAVMAVFNNEIHAVQAAFRAIQTFPYNFEEQQFHLDIKLGIHSGSTIAVNLNQQIDYFGTTVNLAARIQGLARAGELVISDKVYEQAGDFLNIKPYTREQVNLKGLPDLIEIIRLDAHALRNP